MYISLEKNNKSVDKLIKASALGNLSLETHDTYTNNED